VGINNGAREVLKGSREAERAMASRYSGSRKNGAGYLMAITAMKNPEKRPGTNLKGPIWG
jgi:hypothetical protein